MIPKRDKQAVGQRFLSAFRGAGAVEVAPDILLPADTLLDLYGEDIRARAYTSTDPLRGEVMLRPDFTVPVVQMHMAGGAEPARYCYLGEVFRKQDHGDTRPAHPRDNEYLQAGFELFSRDAQADAEVFALFHGILAPCRLSATMGDMDLLLDAADPETGRAMTRDELRDNLLTFIVAGHETTALTLAWALYLCAFDPGVQDRAAAEAQAVLGDRAATEADLPALPLIQRIVNEALRLYPPAAFLSRTAQVADRLCGREVLPGDTVMLPIYALHRHHLLWDRPDAFDPDRFLTAPDRYAYLPFGAGPRICIGASFALHEAVIILSTLLARFRFHAIPGRNPQPRMILTLRPHGGVWLKVTPR